MERTVTARRAAIDALDQAAQVDDGAWEDAPPPDTSRHWTSADLDDVGDPWEESHTRYEIIEGTLYVSKQASLEHQYASSQVAYQFHRWNETARSGIMLPDVGLIFADDDNAAPDLVWCSWDRFRAARGEDGKLHLAPELAVEVLSPGARNARRDRVVKLDLYSRRGVTEYWLVDCRRRMIEVYRSSEATPGRLRLALTVQEHEHLESSLLPGLRLQVANLFLPADL